MLKRILYSVHRILGTILSILFLVWFLSGFVMIYHTFPKVSNKDRYAHMDVLHDSIPAIDKVLNNSDSTLIINKLLLKTQNGSSFFEITTPDRKYRITDDLSIKSIEKPDYNQIQRYASKWSHAQVMQVDTLYDLDQWIPFGQLRKDFPIYKFYFDNDEKHQLYISSLTGEALQFTNKDNRFWAWCGAIPHWVYFTSLRQDSQLWMDVVIWLSGIGCIMCLAGIILGIRSYIIQYRRKKKWKTPYKKFAYKWHHILGFFFGIFVFTFVFSGMMSLAKVPQWMVKVHNTEISNNIFKARPVVLNSYKLDYQKILDAHPNRVKSIEWTSFADVPLYNVIIDDMAYVFDASGEEVRPLDISEEMIKHRFSKIHRENITITQLSDYDNYYVATNNRLSLPVYKVGIADADNSTYYINPKNGDTRYYNTNSKTRRWMYQGLHSFNLGFLVKRPVLWNIIMWTTMIGGTLVSLTGVWLGIRYIRRLIKRFIKYTSKQTR